MTKAFLAYIPHGVSHTQFFKVADPTERNTLAEMKKKLFAGADIEFVVLYNNRNIRRKMTGDVILAYQLFLKQLPEKDRDKCRLVLHTQPIDENGTDLPTLIQDIAPEIKVVFSVTRLDTKTLNDLYNVSDVVINLASNEGFGLGTLEAIMAERMIIANVTGGLQDQMGFTNDAGEYLDPNTDFTYEWGSNHDGRFRNHGEWVIPCFPVQRALIGSPPTPYIFDDRCSWEDAAKAIRKVYDMTPAERARRGALGREYALAENFTAEVMGEKFIEGIDAVFAQWKPRQAFTLTKV